MITVNKQTSKGNKSDKATRGKANMAAWTSFCETHSIVGLSVRIRDDKTGKEELVPIDNVTVIGHEGSAEKAAGAWMGGPLQMAGCRLQFGGNVSVAWSKEALQEEATGAARALAAEADRD